jgi:ribosomal protein L24
MKEGEQISINSLQDKGHHGKILKTMKGVKGLSRISRSGEQKDAPITKAHYEISKRRQAIHKHNQLSKRSFHKVVRYHHPSNDKVTILRYIITI